MSGPVNQWDWGSIDASYVALLRQTSSKAAGLWLSQHPGFIPMALLYFDVFLHRTGGDPNGHLRNGDLDAATQSAETATALATRIGVAEQEGYAELSLGLVSWFRGEYQQTIHHYQQALQAGRNSGLPFIQVSALCGLGMAHLDISSQLSEQSVTYHMEALELLDKPLGMVTGGAAWADLGFCLLANGKVQEAGQFFQKGLDVPTAFSILAKPLLLAGSAIVAMVSNDAAKASGLVREALEFAEERAMKHFYPLIHLVQAQVSLASGDPASGLESFKRAEGLALEMGMRPFVWQARGGAAQVLTGMGQNVEAAAKRSGALTMINEIAALLEDENLRSMYLEDAIKKLG